ncbi:unnamed protein product [Heligmosomoides polygyrus]|uniref:Ground-like domain-containing protein n=1 Tax=Heligmosomoides polygyrus TaxID=6339 RepID=A0A183F446_HELPZ|nr:unnamed protein product [Heligmosomoides polygyrus]
MKCLLFKPCSRAPAAVQSPCSSPFASYPAPMGYSMQYGQAPPSAYAAPPQYQLPAPIPLPYSSSGYPGDPSGYMQDAAPYAKPQPPPPPPPAPRAPVYVAPPPPVYITPAPVVYVTTPPPPKCWRDQEGFECCSRDLQNFLRDALSSPTYAPKGCNLQKAANDLQAMAQNRFNFSFEAIVSPSEMANKSHFKANLICKMRTRDGKVNNEIFLGAF